MKVIQISSQWYVARLNPDNTFTILSGPYQEKHWAVSQARLLEID